MGYACDCVALGCNGGCEEENLGPCRGKVWKDIDGRVDGCGREVWIVMSGCKSVN